MKFPLPNEHILPDEIESVPPRKLPPTGVDINRFIGSLVGLAVGDALGASVEFRPYQYFVDNPVRDMKGGGTWGLKAGQWTDDTSMALCLASSLITKKDYDPYDQMVRYKWWYKFGYLSSTGHCFDIGNATRDSLEEFTRRQKILLKKFLCTSDEVDNLLWDQVQSVKEFNIDCSSPGVAGNGALMRLAPVPLFFYKFPSLAVEYAGRSARLTHGDQKAVDACRYYAALIVAAVRGESKDKLLSNNFYETHIDWFGTNRLADEILRIAHGSYKRQNGYADGIRGKGYVVNALEAALWAFWSDKGSFEIGALAAVNLGDDTDTTAAIYGQLAGASYGYEMIPKEWLEKLYASKLLSCIGQWLYVEGSQYKGPRDAQTTISTAQDSTMYSSDKKQPDIHTLSYSESVIPPNLYSTVAGIGYMSTSDSHRFQSPLQYTSSNQNSLNPSSTTRFTGYQSDTRKGYTGYGNTEQSPTSDTRYHQSLGYHQNNSSSRTFETDARQPLRPTMSYPTTSNRLNFHENSKKTPEGRSNVNNPRVHLNGQTQYSNDRHNNFSEVNQNRSQVSVGSSYLPARNNPQYGYGPESVDKPRGPGYPNFPVSSTGTSNKSEKTLPYSYTTTKRNSNNQTSAASADNYSTHSTKNLWK